MLLSVVVLYRILKRLFLQCMVIRLFYIFPLFYLQCPQVFLLFGRDSVALDGLLIRVGIISSSCSNLQCLVYFVSIIL